MNGWLCKNISNIKVKTILFLEILISKALDCFWNIALHLFFKLPWKSNSFPKKKGPLSQKMTFSDKISCFFSFFQFVDVVLSTLFSLDVLSFLSYNIWRAGGRSLLSLKAVLRALGLNHLMYRMRKRFFILPY